MGRLFRETPIFTEKLKAIGNDDLLRLIQDLILEDPEIGATIAGTGGVRKMRARTPRGGRVNAAV